MNKLLCLFVWITCATAQEPGGRLQFDWSKLAAKATDRPALHHDSNSTVSVERM